jgi:hypothetical protein
MKIVHNTNRGSESRRDEISSTNPGLSNWLLIIGGAIIVGSAVYTMVRLDDKTVVTILIPGVVLGLILVGVSIVTRRRT